MKKRKILYLFPLAALILSGCTFQEGYETAKNFIGNNVYFPVRNFFAGLFGKAQVDPTKKDEKQGEDQKPSGDTTPDTPVVPGVKHAGTLADPFDGADAMLVANALEPNGVTTDSYYIRGKVTEITKPWEANYGSYTFKIEGDFLCWQLKWGEKQEKFAEGEIAVDYVVTMYAQIQLYGQETPTAETKGGYVTKIEKPSQAEPTSIEIVGNPQTSYLSGDKYNHENLKVTAHFDGAEDEDVTKGAEWTISKEIAEVGDESITITATYGGKSASKVVAVTVTDSSGPQHAGTKDDPYSGTDACIVASALESKTSTTDAYYIQGTVQSITEYSASYHNYTFTIEGGFVAYRLKKGPSKADFEENDIKVGDTVLIHSTIKRWYDTLETGDDGYVAAVNGVEFGGDTPPTPTERQELPYTGNISGGKLPAGWTGDGETFATEYYALKAANKHVLAKQLINAVNKLKVGVTGICNGTTTDSTVTVYGLNDEGNRIQGASSTYTPDKASASNASAVEAAATEKEVTIEGEGITGVEIELTVKGHNYAMTCIKLSEPPLVVNSLSIEQETATLHLDGTGENANKNTVSLTAVVDPTNAPVTWQTNKESVATVSSEGVVTAVKAGTATITATAGDKSDTCEVTVVQHVKNISVEDFGLVEGNSAALNVTVLPEDATDKSFTIDIKDTTVAKVNETSGEIEALSAGTTEIEVTSTDGGFKDSCSLTVSQNVVPVDSVTRVGDEVRDIHINDEVQLAVTVGPSTATEDMTVTWSKFNDSDVISLSPNGLVKGLKEGSATVRATSNAHDNLFAEFTINVTKVAVSSVTLNKTELELEIGDEETLTPTVAPEEATFPEVTWSLENASPEDCVTLADGKVTAVKAGTATVKATADGKSATCAVTVLPAKGTEQRPYTASEAHTAASATDAPDTYVKGIIYKVESFSSQYKSLTYWISDTGLGNSVSKDGVQIYSGKGLSGADFTALNNLQPGDEVVVKGTLKLYSGKAELDKNNVLISLDRPTVSSLAITGTEKTEYNVNDPYSPVGLSVIATFDNNKTADVTDFVEWQFLKGETPVTNAAVGDSSITIKASYGGQTVTRATTVVVSAEATNYGTEQDPLTVAEAIAVIKKESSGTAENMYVKGVVKSNTAWSTKYNNMDIYFEVPDGELAFQVFRATFKNAADQTTYAAENSLVGAEIVVGGSKGLIYNSSKYELDQGSQVLSITPAQGGGGGEEQTGDYLTQTAAYSGTTTNMDGSNQASSLGITDSHISISGQKLSGSNNVGLNSAGQFRVYQNSQTSITISVSGGSIVDIQVNCVSNYLGTLTVNGNAVTASGTTYNAVVGSDTAVLLNTHASTQMRITSIVIHYTLN